MSEDRMTEQIRTMLTPTLKSKFYKKCNGKSTNPSELIRDWIMEFIVEGSE